jgi:NAD(P)-dependent dehydrogenase (short-subunit alcohol dehydrogenase family)
VTGGASGIGRATVRALAAAGAKVAVVDRDAEGAEHVAKDASAADDACAVKAFTVDLVDVAAIEPLLERVLDAFGGVDILVNCAGISGIDHELQSSLDFSDAAFETVIAVNLRAPSVLIREVGKHMIRRGRGGRIVNVSSSAAFQASGVPAIYAASKAGLNGLTRVAAGDLAVHGIRVNAVAPGLTKTPMTGAFDDETYHQMVSGGPFENLTCHAAEPEDVARVIRFLCLPDSCEITGQIIHTSGGLVV